MTNLEFNKFEGFGNDYIVFESENIPLETDLSKLAIAICNRHFGAGSDGIALLEKSIERGSDYACRIINPDGSEAGFSGNGTRCAVSQLYYSNKWSDSTLRLKTLSGIKQYEFLKRENDTFWFRAELGKPTDIVNLGNKIAEFEFKEEAISLDVGNPVVAIFVEDFVAQDWRRIGKSLENNIEIFPDRTNVVFVRVCDRSNIEIRIWERGASETNSSGTCSIAAAIASAYSNRTNRVLSVNAVGGTTEAIWRADDEMLITGRADLAYSGIWKLK